MDSTRESSTPYQKMPEPPSRLSAQLQLIFGCGAIPPAVKADLLNNYLFYYYNQVLSLSSGLVATASALALVVDAIMDPLIGWVSDRTVSRFGRRHPFIFASLLPSTLSYFALLTVRWGGEAATQEQLFAQLFGLLCALRISWALYEVPRGALAPEICKGYDERTALHGISMACGWLGGGLMSFATKQVFLGQSYDDPQGYERLARWGSGMLFVFGLLFACCTPHSPSTLRHSSSSSSAASASEAASGCAAASSSATASASTSATGASVKSHLVRGSEDEDDEDGSEHGEGSMKGCANVNLLRKLPSSSGKGGVGNEAPRGVRDHLRDALHTLSHSDFLAILLAGLVYNLYLGVTMGLGACTRIPCGDLLRTRRPPFFAPVLPPCAPRLSIALSRSRACFDCRAVRGQTSTSSCGSGSRRTPRCLSSSSGPSASLSASAHASSRRGTRSAIWRSGSFRLRSQWARCT